MPTGVRQPPRDAIDVAGKAGTINLGFVYENPPASVVLRFGPGMVGAETAAASGS